jgi:hypothetical protein
MKTLKHVYNTLLLCDCRFVNARDKNFDHIYIVASFFINPCYLWRETLFQPLL